MFRRFLLVAVAGGLLLSPLFPAQADDMAVVRHARSADSVRLIRTLVIPVAFADGQPTGVTPEILRQRVFTEVSAFWQETSYGKLHVVGEGTPWLLLHTLTSCSTSATRQGLLASFDQLIDFRQYEQVIVVAPFAQAAGGAPCPWTVQSDVPALPTATADGIVPLSFAYVQVNSATAPTLAYALGRTLGLDNANFLDCAADTIIALNCRVNEYGNYYSVMSRPSTPRHLTAPERERLGLFDAAQAMSTIDRSVTVPLSPIESASAGIKALKIQRSGHEPLYVEYRQPIGADVGMDQAGFSTVFQGVLLHTARRGESHPLLIDPTPPGEPHRAALLVGETFVDPLTNIRVSAVHQTPSALWVQVVVPRVGEPTRVPGAHQREP